MKKTIISLLVLVAFAQLASAQENVILEKYTNQKEVIAYNSITLKPGFTIQAGAAFNAYISPAQGGAVQNRQKTNPKQNYIITYNTRNAGIVDPSDTTNLNSNVNTTIEYVDGWGRPVGIIDVKSSPGSKSTMLLHEYDDMGREPKKYLPYTKAAEVGYNLPDTYGQSDFYTNGADIIHTSYPFSETRYEQTAMNRVLEEGVPGDHWQLSTSTSPNKGHTKTYWYDPARKEALYTATINTITGRRSLYRGGNSSMYPLEALQRVAVRDENIPIGTDAGMVTESTDMEGRVIMRRIYNMNGAVKDTLSTYYVYDNYGNLCFVLPPAANPDAKAAISQATLDKYCYQYLYDGRQRMTAKKIPGKGWEYMVYNKLDQLIMTQDSVQRGKSPQEWTVTKYDALGRIVLTGIHTRAGTANTNYLSTVQGEADVAVPLWETKTTSGNGYTTSTYPASLATVLSVNYYDDYSIPGLPAAYNQSASYTKMTRGLATASKANILGSSNYLWSVNFYDDDARLVRTIQQHNKGGVNNTNNYDDISNAYNFTGDVTESIRKHFVGGVESLYVKNTFTYDPQGRKKDTYQTTGSTSATTANAAVLLSRNEYNELGQLKRKRLHSTDGGGTFKQDITYTYNERGWLKTQSAPLFSETLRYQDAPNGVTPQYNGNISRQEWTGSKYYNYAYDNLNRLKSAVSSTGNNEVIGYDAVGNITRLQRKLANTLIDQLGYTYNDGNRLASVQDTNSNVADLRFQLAGTTAYSYDGNGNLVARNNAVNSGNNLTSISYNVLNLPKTMTYSGSTITYTYDAAGTKLRKVMGSSVNNDYIGGIHYEGGNFAFVQTEVGRAVKNGTGTDPVYNYEYTLTDHLGNGRVYFDIYSNAARKVQEMDYYAFGLGIQQGSLIGTENKYQYNGKEKQDQEKMFDYDARFYDPVIARWQGVDPLAEKMRRYSPYAFVYNNPIRFVDPDGMEGDDFVQRQDGSVYWDKNANDQNSTKQGETYLGKNLKFEFTSYIDKNTWDGPTLGGLIDPSGIKLTSTINLTGRENAAGELTSLVGTANTHPGETPMGTARNFYPGPGGRNNLFSVDRTSTGVSLNFEQHASVSPGEQLGLNAMGFKIVDVAQKLNINYTSSTGGLSISASTGIFPSATLKMNRSLIMQYDQPSFVSTHIAPIIGTSSPTAGSLPIRDFSYYPSKFYPR